jgi:diguanylate cyclase (GGDEF)-like protein
VAFGDNVIGMTVSVGLAMARKSDHSIEQIIARADTALYRAKESGRNRTIAYGNKNQREELAGDGCGAPGT